MIKDKETAEKICKEINEEIIFMRKFPTFDRYAFINMEDI